MKRDRWIVLLAFLGGIVLTNLLGKDFLATYGVINEYFLSQYSYQEIDGNRLFVHIVMERCQEAFFIFLLGRAVSGKLFSVLVKGITAASFGFLAVVGLVNLGLRGLVVIFGGLFPQWLCYLAALFLYANWRREEENQSWSELKTDDIPGRVAVGMILLLCILLGIVLESWVNPLILGGILKLF